MITAYDHGIVIITHGAIQERLVTKSVETHQQFPIND